MIEQGNLKIPWKRNSIVNKNAQCQIFNFQVDKVEIFEKTHNPKFTMFNFQVNRKGNVSSE